MPLPTITPLPSPPSRSSAPATFSNDADAFFNAFPGLVAQINDFGSQLPAAVNGIDYNGTSTTSNTIGTGSKTFTTQTGKNFQIGQFVVVANTPTPANFMTGQVTAYNSGTGSITINVTAVGGSGTFTAWTIALSASSTAYLPISGGTLTGSVTFSSGGLGIGVAPLTPLDVSSGTCRVRVDLSSTSPTWLYTNPTVSGYSQASHDALSHRWAASGSFGMAYTTTGLGVGTLTPQNRLDIVGPAFNAAVSTTYAAAFANSGGASGDVTIGSDATAGYIQSWAAKPLYLNGQGNNILIGPGSVGVNTDTPTARVDINGTARIRGGLTLDTALAIAQGGTGATTAAAALAALGGQGAISLISGGSGTALSIRIGSTTYYLMFLTVGSLAGNGSATLTYPVSLTTAVLAATCSKYASGPINDGLNLSGAPGLGSCAVVNGGTATSGGYAIVFGY